MSLILNIETATKNCSVSLAENGTLILLKEENTGNYSHSEKLHVLINAALQEAGKSFKELDAVAVSKGPGSYTGLRIGVSAAKGLCFALDKPLISVPTLNLLARSIHIEQGGVIVPMLDARRMEVYSAVYDTAYNQLREVRAEIIDEQSFLEYLSSGKVYFLGDGSEKCQTVIRHANAVFLEGYFPSAKDMTELSFDKYKKSDIEDVAYFEPYYLKDFIISKVKK
ncbi:MAG: tRNA (adenosine(37)-N6)-threonylcarbamoyltransferase complex dimerization subunit type 1 TsaB [Flavobacteriaceae bacterium]|nr:tRNA (adenosine(37)-N6)-threonylcarbamoyltransferase complex dimerization subunit type 1 TsaB [Flavobacteriaceae bacterium]